jgi:chromosome partitioning protein
LSVEAVRGGNRVELLDLDPAQSAAKWWRRRGGPENPSLAFGVTSMPAFLAALAKRSPPDVLVVDTPGELLGVIRDAITEASAVVVPIAPSVKDWEALDACEAIINSTGKRDAALFVVNRFRANTESSIEIRRALHTRTGAIPLTVALATDHERADALGKTGAEINTRIAGEIGLLWQEAERIGTRVKKHSIPAA